MRISFRTKLAIIFFTVIIMMVLFLFYSLNINKNLYINEVGHSSIILAEEMFKRMNQRIFYLTGQLQIEMNTEFIQKNVSDSNDKFSSIQNLNKYIQENEENWSNSKNTSTSFVEELMDNTMIIHLKEIFIDLFEHQFGFVSIEYMSITNKFGANIAVSSIIDDYYQGDEDWWQQTRDNTFYIGEFAYNEDLSDYIIIMAIRINDTHGKFAGILAVGLNLKNIIREAEVGIHKYNTTQVQLITKSGELIYSTMPHKFLDDISNESFYIHYLESEYLFYSDTDNSRLYSFANSGGFKFFKGFDWVLVISHHLDEILEPYIDLQNQIIIVSFLFFFFCIIITFLMGNMISAPIKSFSKSLKNIGDGIYGQRITIKSKDEFGDLADTFNLMLKKRELDELTIRESEEKYRTLFENANDAIAIQDENHIFIECNNKALKIFKVTKKQLIGKNSYSISPEYQPDGTSSKEKAIELGNLALNSEPQFFEWEIIRGDGTKMQTEVSLTKIELSGKKYLQAIIRDITERKEAETQIGQLSSELLKAQEKENQKISKYLHDSVMQTLTASKLNFDVYKMDPVKQKNRLNLGIEFLNKASNELKEIYTNLYPSILTDFGFEKTIIWYIKSNLEIIGIETEFEFNVKEKLKHDFEVNLFRIFQEIFSNIIKHSKAKCVKITVEQRKNRSLAIKVWDDGKGIGKDEMNNKKGFGLKKIRQRVMDFNGIIDINSGTNKGTTFNFEFPV